MSYERTCCICAEKGCIMTEERKENDILMRGLKILAAIVIIIAGMKAAAAIVAPVMVAIFVVITLLPFVRWMTRHRVPTPIAVLIVLLGILIVGTCTGILIGQSVHLFTENLPYYQERLKVESAVLIHYVEQLGFNVPEKGIFGLIDSGAALSMAANVLRDIGQLMANTFLVLLIAMLMLLEVAEIPQRIRKALGRPDINLGWFNAFSRNVYRYLAIKTCVSLATGICVGIWLWVLGVDFPILWGLLAFVLHYAPTVGSIVAAIPAILFTIVQLGWEVAILVAIGYLAINTVWGMILEPRFMGMGLGMSTLIVFISMLFWGWVLGNIGIFLSVPLTMTAIIALKSKPETKWIPAILGSGDAD
jgi:AI-2 transport protein TqsA